MSRSSRCPRTPKVDVSEELIASMEEAVRIMSGELAPTRVHTAESLAASVVERATTGLRK